MIFCAGIGSGANAEGNEELTEGPFRFGASYISDNVNNLRGGIRSGHGYLGMVNFALGFDAGKAGLWEGGTFFINAVNTHGATPSADMLGDRQVVSNIEAGDHTYLQELWYKQTLGNVELTLGLQDMNVEFANSDNGAIFLNSSFGILPIISGNIAAPLFPLTSLGFTAKWNVRGNTAWLNAIYDGSPTDFGYNPHNLRWEFASGDGILAISEIQQRIEIRCLPGTYKLGVFTHNHLLEKNFNRSFPDSLNHSTFGVYAYADQKILARGERSLDLFIHTGYSPSKTCSHDAYLGAGVSFYGWLSQAKDDILGLAIAHVNFAEGIGRETAIELTWQKQVHQNIFIQPDLQYVIKPSGGIQGLDNFLVAILRVGLSL